MKRLLMATDLSARSDRALARAVDLAREHGAQLTVIHVIDEDLPTSLAAAQQTAAKLAIEDHVSSLTSDGSPTISIQIVFGRAFVDILKGSEQLDADLVALGMHRENVFKDMFRGTTVERIVRAGNVPVLLVKNRVSRPYRRVMVGVDFSVYSRRAVEFAINFVPNGTFHLVHAFDVPFKGFLFSHDMRREISQHHQAAFQDMIDEEMTTFLATLEAKAPKVEPFMQEGMVREVIHRQIDELKPDLLVIGTHGRTGVAHAFLGSVAEDLLTKPPCDVLAVTAW